MSAYINQFFFGVYPYLCLAVFVVGSALRFEHAQYSWRSGSSQLLRRRQLIAGSVLFHVGVLIVFLGHVIGLLTPIRVFEAIGISHGAKQIMAIVVGGIAGAMALAGGLLLAHRRLFDARVRAASSFGDAAILLLLLAQLLLGLSTIAVSIRHLDGVEMVRFMEWAQRLLTFRGGAAELVADAHPLFKAHLFLGLTIFLVFPFTRLVHMLSAPVWYLNRRGWQIVRTKSAAAQSKPSPAPAE
jgi:nitrate reductase gamma subunit